MEQSPSQSLRSDAKGGLSKRESSTGEYIITPRTGLGPNRYRNPHRNRMHHDYNPRPGRLGDDYSNAQSRSNTMSVTNSWRRQSQHTGDDHVKMGNEYHGNEHSGGSYGIYKSSFGPNREYSDRFPRRSKHHRLALHHFLLDRHRPPSSQHYGQQRQSKQQSNLPPRHEYTQPHTYQQEADSVALRSPLPACDPQTNALMQWLNTKTHEALRLCPKDSAPESTSNHRGQDSTPPKLAFDPSISQAALSQRVLSLLQNAYYELDLQANMVPVYYPYDGREEAFLQWENAAPANLVSRGQPMMTQPVQYMRPSGAPRYEFPPPMNYSYPVDYTYYDPNQVAQPGLYQAPQMNPGYGAYYIPPQPTQMTFFIPGDGSAQHPNNIVTNPAMQNTNM